MQTPSEQQKVVVDAIKFGNVQVIAVAGCGKTTTNLFIARDNPQKNVLLLTYNSNLRLETVEKLEKYKIDNLRVHTYHSFAYHFYQKCLNDFGLYKILLNSLRPNLEHSDDLRFDIIILDEMQDMSLLYFRFICKILADNKVKTPHVCLLGDPHQTIYQFNGSSAGYFLNFPLVFPELPWTTCTLDVTYRCTDQIGNFLNKVMLAGEQRIATRKSGPMVKYLMCQNTENEVFKEIKNLIDSGEYSCDDIFVLAPSVRTPSSPVRKLSEICSLKNIPVFVSYSDEDKPNTKVLKNKLVFLTFHQCKGLERKVVFILSFDQSYFMFFKKDYDPTKCPNEMYVAVTRSLERLFVVHNTKYDYLAFLKKELLPTHCDYVEKSLHSHATRVAEISSCPFLFPDHFDEQQLLQQQQLQQQVHLQQIDPQETTVESVDKAMNMTVTNIIKKINYKEMYELFQTLHVDYLVRPGKMMNIPSIITVRRPLMDSLSIYQSKRHKSSLMDSENFSQLSPSGGALESENFLLDRINFQLFDEKNVLYENVSDINSLLIMTMFEHRVTPKLFAKKYGDFDPKNLEFNTQKCAVRTCVENKYFFKLNQIDKFNWLSLKEVEKCLKRLDKFDIHNTSLFEHELKYHHPEGNFTLWGRVDCMDSEKDSIWEFKCVQVLDYEHIIQTALYSFLALKLFPEKHFSNLLYNVLDNQLCRIEIKQQSEFENILCNIIKRITSLNNSQYAHDFSPLHLSSFRQ